MRRPLLQLFSAPFTTTELPKCLRPATTRIEWRGLSVVAAAALSLGCVHPATTARAERSPVGAPLDTAAPARQLKVLTFNLWTVELPVPRFVFEDSKDIDSRLKLLPEKVLETGADILVFQEVWREKRKLELIESFRKVGFPYSIHNKPEVGALERGLLGNGLLIISRFPLSPVPKLLRFSKYTRGIEYFARKGAIKTSVSVPGLGWIDLVDAHFGAVSTEKENGHPDHFNRKDLSILSNQVQELVQFISGNQSSGIVLAAMDMNAHYQVLAHGSYQPSFAPEYAMMTCAGLTPAVRASGEACLGLMDTFRQIHGFEGEPAWTYDTKSNRYAGNGLFADEPPGVLDYIFVNDNPKLVPVSSEVVFKEQPTDADRRTGGLDARARLPIHLSDHYGVVTTFEIRS